jgi:hypothetical protein
MRSYSIPDLLYGTYYRSTSYPRYEGIINFAEKRDNVYLDEDWEAFSIRYRVDGTIVDRWATISVRTGGY